MTTTSRKIDSSTFWEIYLILNELKNTIDYGINDAALCNHARMFTVASSSSSIERRVDGFIQNSIAETFIEIIRTTL